MQKLEAKIRNLLVEKKANCSNKAIVYLRFSDEAINVLAAEIAGIIDKVEPFAPIFHKSDLSINRRVFIDLAYSIFSDNTIVDSYEYSINLIKKMYHSEEHNITKSQKKMFYEIFGFTYNYHFKNTNVLIYSFNRAYNDFDVQGERPVYVMEILKNAFNKRLPLSCFDNEPLAKFKSNRNYILYGLITEFGKDGFLDYLNDMINQYRESVYNLDSLITFHSIAAYIYGEDAVLAHSFHYRYVYDEYNHTLFSLTYKAIYPVTYYHSKSFAQRMIIYKFLELSESEIKGMENNRHSVNWKKPSNRIYANINEVANSEKDDISSDGIMSRIKEQVDVLYSVAISKRTLPNRKDLFNHLRKTADNEMLKIITYLPNHALSYSKFLIYIEEKNNELKKFFCNNNDQIKFNTNVWKYWERNRTKYECITLIFSDLETTYYKNIQKKYMKYVVINNFGAELIRRAYSVKNFLIFLEHQFEVIPLIEEIRTDYILLFLHYIETKDKVTPKQLSRRVTALKRFFKGTL